MIQVMACTWRHPAITWTSAWCILFADALGIIHEIQFDIVFPKLPGTHNLIG